MALEVERIGNEPIVVMHFLEPFDGAADVGRANEITAQLLQEMGAPIYRIEHVGHMELDFSKMVAGLGASKKAVTGSMADTNVYGIFVGEGDIPEMTAKAFSQGQYGGKEVPFFNSVQEAITHARQQMKK